VLELDESIVQEVSGGGGGVCDASLPCYVVFTCCVDGVVAYPCFYRWRCYVDQARVIH